MTEGNLNRSTGLSKAAKKQDKVGWHHMFRGHLVKEWGAFLPNQSEYGWWHTKVEVFFLEWGRACWSLQCEEQNSEGKVVTGSVLYKQIKEMYQLQESFNMRDPNLYRLPMKRCHADSHRKARKWVNLAYKSYSAR